MSKTEELAEKAYPAWRNGIGDEFSSNSAYYGFIEGFEQAEKDLELTWEDIKDILNIYEEVIDMDFCEDIYGEVLKRFKAFKERKKK